jgi:hypothetical protein
MAHQWEKKKESGEVVKNSQPPKINSTYSDYPYPLDRVFRGMEMMGSFGVYYFSIGPLLTFTILL